MSDRDQLRQALADAIAADLESKGFMGWFANANSSLWAERTPEQEIGRVSAYALLPVVDAHVQAERERIAAAIEALRRRAVNGAGAKPDWHDPDGRVVAFVMEWLEEATDLARRGGAL